MLINNSSFGTVEYFYCFISHFNAIAPYFEAYADLTDLLEKGVDLLKKYPPQINFDNKTKISIQNETTASCIAVNQKDNLEEELKRQQEQNTLDKLKVHDVHYAKVFQLFLHDVWKYALGTTHDRAFASKKVYIVLDMENTIQTKTEWVYTYIETLKNHLTYAGFCVYPQDLLDSKNSIGSDIDHVLVISHREKVNDIVLNKQITEHPHYQNKKPRFVIPILLNNINYLYARI